MARTRRGVRDGTGPRKGSRQQVKYGVGRRQRMGVKCPARGK